MPLLDKFHVAWFSKPSLVSSSGRMISHFELYFDLVLVRPHLQLHLFMYSHSITFF